MPTIMIGNSGYKADRLPDVCPICHYSVESVQGFSASKGSMEGLREIIEVVMKCPRSKCSRLFIARYSIADLRRQGSLELFDTLPATPLEPDFSDDIKSLSPDFVKIFAQSQAAEAYKFDQVCGVGYRKALEFLIKDYCISLYPDRAEEVKATFLGTCIKEYVDDSKVKKCAELATWLGNDETHYVRKWEDKDIEDLKNIIALTMIWIESSILTQKYIDGMGTGSKV